MEEVRQLISSRQARILKSMTDSRAAEQDSQVVELEREKKEKRTAAEKPETSEQQARHTRLAEADARKALARVDPNRPRKEGEPTPRKLQEMSLDELYAEYDHWERLEQRLKKYSHDEDLLGAIKIQTEQVRNELLLHGGVPRKDLQALAEMPVTYSATLLNDLAQSTLGISVQGDSKDGNVSIDASGIHVPEGPLTLEHTLEIARMLTQEHSELLSGKEAELAEFGQKIRELATYLAGQTKDGKGKESIFQTEEQKQAIVQLYNAGVWLSKLGKTTTEQVNGQQKPIKNIEEWGELEGRGRKYLQGLSKEKEADVLEFLFGKGLAKGRIPTSYERLLQHHGGSPEALRQWLQGHGSRMVRLLAPHIAESFAQEGRAATAIARGVARGATSVVPDVIFEQARGRAGEIRLPKGAVEIIQAKFGISLPDAERQLVAAARQLRSSDVFARMPLERRLEELNRMVQSFQAPHETSGDTVRGYKLAEVFDNVDAELGCSLRAYLLVRLINEVYQDVPTSQRPSVTANTLLLPHANGVVGHTRLMVADPSVDQVFVVDPSVQRNINSAVHVITSRELAEQVREVALTGKSANIFVPQEAGEVMVKHQTIGDAITSQEANILANIAAAVTSPDDRESDRGKRQQLLQMALQRDPNNQMALLHLAALLGDSKQEQDVYLGRLKQLNPDLSDATIQKMLTANASEFQVAFSFRAITNTHPDLQDFLARSFQQMGLSGEFDRDDLIEAYANPRLGLSPKDYIQFRQQLAARLATLPPADPDRILIETSLLPEIDAAVSKEAIQKHIQRTLQQLEKDAATPTGFTQLEGNYTISNQLRNFVNEMDESMWASLPPGSSMTAQEGKEFINQLRAELHVRTAGHDISYLGRLKGEGGVNQMVEAANRFTTEEYLEVEALPGVALVRRLYEQEAIHFLAEHPGIGPNDFETIKANVDARFAALKAAGVILFNSGDPVLDQLQEERARTVGRNLFIIKTRLAHFIAYGDPVESATGLAIGNSPWDFLAKIYSPYRWMMQRYGMIPEHAHPLVDSIGEDKINKILYLQDHDSSVWRIPAFIEQFDAMGLTKQALFMRLYWTGEAAYTGDKAHVHELRQELVDQIIMYVPEELVSVFRDYVDRQGNRPIRAILQDPNYQHFLTAIMQAREQCIVEGDFEYGHFDEYLRNYRTPGTNESVYDIYEQLTQFLRGFRRDLSNPEHIFTFTHHGKAEKVKNPLFQERVVSLADAPFELIDKAIVLDPQTGRPVLNQGRIQQETGINTALSNKLGGQDVGREWGNVSDASKAMGGVIKFLSHPSLESLKELKGLFVGYKGWGWDEEVRDTMFEGFLRFAQEDPGLRLLMPGIDRLVANFNFKRDKHGKWHRGGSEAQRQLGMRAESFDMLELEGLIRNAETEGLITRKKAADLIQMVDFARVLKFVPLVQILVVIAIFSIIRTALSPKALLAA